MLLAQWQAVLHARCPVHIRVHQGRVACGAFLAGALQNSQIRAEGDAVGMVARVRSYTG